MLKAIIVLVLSFSNLTFSSTRQGQFIKIRGSGKPCEYIPSGASKSWRIWTFSRQGKISEVETEGFQGESWVDPTSYSDLFLPADLPVPKMNAALGVSVVNGALRYVMPSIVLSLETPDKYHRLILIYEDVNYL